MCILALSVLNFPFVGYSPYTTVCVFCYQEHLLLGFLLTRPRCWCNVWGNENV